MDWLNKRWHTMTESNPGLQKYITVNGLIEGEFIEYYKHRPDSIYKKCN